MPDRADVPTVPAVRWIGAEPGLFLDVLADAVAAEESRRGREADDARRCATSAATARFPAAACNRWATAGLSAGAEGR